jgi:hypothetical protein
LSQLLQDYEGSIQVQGDAEGRKLALVDSRTWSLLAHQWMDERHLEQIDDPVRQLRIAEPLSARLAGALQTGQPVVRMDDYRDPVARFAPQQFGGTWLAAFSPVGDTGWIAVVQEPLAPVLRPVDQLQNRLLWNGVSGMALVAGLVAGGWWLILVGMNDARPRWWPRPWRRRSETTLTS